MNRWLFAVVCVPIVGTAVAQTSRPASGPKATASKKGDGPAMDELSQATLDRWRGLEYHLGRAGVTSLRMKIKVESKSPLGSAKTIGTYSYTAKKSTLTWEDPTLGKMLAERGWSDATFARWLITDFSIRELGRARLTAKKAEDGTVVVKIAGGTRSGLRALRFDQEGRLLAKTLTATSDVTGSAETTFEFQHEKFGARYVLTGWTFRAKGPAGTLTGKTELTHGDLRGFRVLTQIRETLAIEGKTVATQILEISDYELGAAEKPAKK